MKLVLDPILSLEDVQAHLPDSMVAFTLRRHPFWHPNSTREQVGSPVPLGGLRDAVEARNSVWLFYWHEAATPHLLPLDEWVGEW